MAKKRAEQGKQAGSAGAEGSGERVRGGKPDSERLYLPGNNFRVAA